MVTGCDSGVGHDLESCTMKIGMVKVHDIILVDTPGFDDTHMTDIEVLCLIADWLTET
jgi:predicted GTPase